MRRSEIGRYSVGSRRLFQACQKPLGLLLTRNQMLARLSAVTAFAPVLNNRGGLIEPRLVVTPGQYARRRDGRA